MQLFVLLFTLLMPFLQPLARIGADKMHQKLGVQPPQLQSSGLDPMMQPAGQAQPQPQARIMYHNGQWWKYENNQWYVWTQNK